MNCFLCFNRHFNGLNKYFLINKFDVKLNTFLYKLNSNQLNLRLFSNKKIIRNIEELEDSFEKAKGTGGQTTNLIRDMLINYNNSYDYMNRQNPRNETILSRVKHISQEVNQNTIESNDAINSFLIDFFTNCGQLESALEVKNRISPNFRLDSYKIFNLATLLVENNRTNAAINLIETELSLTKKNVNNFRDKRQDIKRLRDKSINKLLNTLIDKQIDNQLIRKIFQMCVEISPTEVNKKIAGPLIRMHLVKKDLSSALNEFLSCAQKYNVIPWSLELMRIFIETNDKKSLDRVVGTVKELHGPYTTALDLSAAYLYNNLEENAKQELNKISRIQQKSVELICDKFIKDQKLDSLKTFILMTKSIDGIDRQKLFSLLINAYKMNGQTDKAIDVLNIMKEQNIKPKELFLNL